ncbi:hypothetical protein GCM10025864_07590 [Luteimicrobium album]|uniref:Lipoprotein n=1 Tax=Luteimicrobium album TaxID=1054550 RepID=A0ABQ6HXB1_9MICO|nr:hypothetical protein [Luteimicrobium album]GMA23000.1 hypothetical protein GCM10025864_07590 [Luteimicrobium album]
MISNRILRTALPVAVLALSAPLFAACSSGGDDAKSQFCNLNKDDNLEKTLSGADLDDPQAAVDAIAKVNDKIKDVDAPDEIKTEWTNVKKFFGDYVKALDGVDVSDTAAYAKALTDSDIQSEAADMSSASTKISSYVSKNCS